MIVERIEIHPNEDKHYPFNLPLFQKDQIIDLNAAVIVFVGENGTGKSSLLKLIQAKLNLVRIRLPEDEIKNEVDGSTITIHLRLGKPHGFFFESQKFINYIDYMQKEIADSETELARVKKEYKDKSTYAKMLAEAPFRRTISELENMYNRDLSRSSHGESYLDFFASRIRDKQIYLLDEPETPLSFQNQLTLMAMILDARRRGCQFIIATHSPVLTAIPEALIYEIIDDTFVKTEYDNVTSIKLMRQFLNDKEQFLHHFDDL